MTFPSCKMYDLHGGLQMDKLFLDMTTESLSRLALSGGLQFVYPFAVFEG